MSAKKTRAKEMADPYPPVDVCCGGTIPVGQNYIPFSNTTGTPQTVSNCVLWGGVVIGIAPGSKNVPVTLNPKPQKGSSYSFTSTCLCPVGTPPTIKVD
jgi:hypothetical protein